MARCRLLATLATRWAYQLNRRSGPLCHHARLRALEARTSDDGRSVRGAATPVARILLECRIAIIVATLGVAIADTLALCHLMAWPLRHYG